MYEIRIRIDKVNLSAVIIVVTVIVLAFLHMQWSPNLEPMVVALSSQTSLAQYTGFADAEPWGRWTNAKLAVVSFNRNLPQHAVVAIKAKAFGPNVGIPIVLRCGSIDKKLSLSGEMQRIELTC